MDEASHNIYEQSPSSTSYAWISNLVTVEPGWSQEASYAGSFEEAEILLSLSLHQELMWYDLA
jgi:hypothetical protein